MKNYVILPLLGVISIASTILAVVACPVMFFAIGVLTFILAPLMRYWTRAGFSNQVRLNTPAQIQMDQVFVLLSVFVGVIICAVGFPFGSLLMGFVFGAIAVYSWSRWYALRGHNRVYFGDGKRYWLIPGDPTLVLQEEGISPLFAPQARPLWFPISFLLGLDSPNDVGGGRP